MVALARTMFLARSMHLHGRVALAFTMPQAITNAIYVQEAGTLLALEYTMMSFYSTESTGLPLPSYNHTVRPTKLPHVQAMTDYRLPAHST